MISLLLILSLSHVAVAMLARYYGRQEGREEELTRTEATLDRMQAEALVREQNYRVLLAEVAALEAMRSTGRRAGRA